MKINLENLTVKDAHKSMVNGEFSAVQLAEAYLDMVKIKNKDINAFIEIYDDVLEQAKKADERIKRGDATLLTGVPIIVKDVILEKGRRASGGSKILENYKATYDAYVIKKLKNEGVVFLGRGNTDEFAMGGSTENSAFGVTKNPYDLSRVSGGSSGGPAAAVSANMALLALGSDTGGSVRQPASFCGIVGMKPTYGAVSRSGLIAMGSSLDQIGVFGKTIEDAEILYDTIKGYDPKDSTSIDEQNEMMSGNDTIKNNDENKKGYKMTIGVPENFVDSGGVDIDVLLNIKEVIKNLETAGHKIRYIKLANIKYSLAAYYIIMPAEASANLSRFDGIRYGLHIDGVSGKDDYIKTRGVGFGKEVRRRIILGTYVLSAGYKDAYYNKAMQVRELVRNDFEEAFESVDVIITPTTPTPAFKIGEKTKDPLQMYLADIFTVPLNLAGLPGISIQSGFVERDGKKLPIGIQIIAPHFKESRLFILGNEIEKTVIIPHR